MPSVAGRLVLNHHRFPWMQSFFCEISTETLPQINLNSRRYLALQLIALILFFFCIKRLPIFYLLVIKHFFPSI